MTHQERARLAALHAAASAAEADTHTSRRVLAPEAGLEQLLTVEDLARLLRVHVKTVYAWVEQGAIPHVRLGRRVLFSPADIGRWVGARKEGG